MKFFDQTLAGELSDLEQVHRRRRLRQVESPAGPVIQVNGRSVQNFSSNDYLGLANDPITRAGALAAVEAYGGGAAASRLICGSLGIFHELEQSIARLKGTESALVFSTGFAAALGAIPALVGPQDYLILNKLDHACMVDGARLSEAQLRVFRHNDLEDLEAKLKWAADQRAKEKEVSRRGRILVVTESVFSMDGDIAPLAEMVRLKNQYEAWLMVDEAHSTGVYGSQGQGLVAALGLSQEVEVQMGTLGKALGSAGGYIAGSQVLVDYLVNKARSFIFSTAPVPAQAGAALAAVRWLSTPEAKIRRQSLWQRIRELAQFFDLPGAATITEDSLVPYSPIFPLILGAESTALEEAQRLLEQGYFIPAIRFPTVPRNQARLRCSLSAAHTPEAVAALCSALEPVKARLLSSVGPVD